MDSVQRLSAREGANKPSKRPEGRGLNAFYSLLSFLLKCSILDGEACLE